MTKPKKTEHTNESNHFRDLMHGVAPLSHTKVTLRSNQPRIIKPRLRPENTQEDAHFQFSDYESLPAVSSEEYLEFARSGLQHKMLRKMRQGQYNATAILDLHGKRIEEACEALAEFLLHCQKTGSRHVLIIHGKGRPGKTPVLKNKLNHWLRQTEQVLAFCTALPQHGGSGALYVLLRR